MSRVHAMRPMRMAGALFGLCAAGALQAASVLPPATVVELPNGTRLQLVEKHEVPVVVLEASLRGGALADPPGQEGASALLAEWLRKGAAGRDAHAFADTVEGVGGELSTAAELESVRVSAKFLSEDVGLMVELVADALQTPRFDTAEFTRLRDRAIDQLIAARDGDPSEVLGLYAQAWLMPGQAYSRPVGGNERSLARLTPEAVKALWREQLGADRLTLTAVGDFDAARMQALLERGFTSWRKASAPAPNTPASTAAAGGRVLLVDKPGATQTYFTLGSVGPSRRDPDRALQDLANTQFGGRFTSLLNTELRIKSGLSYGAGSSLARFGQPGPIRLTSFTATETTAQALDLALTTLARYREQGMDATALESVRQYNLGRYPFRLETAQDIAAAYSSLALYRLPPSDIDSDLQLLREATLAQVNTLIPRLYPPQDALSMVLIGDADQIRSVARKYGTVTEMRISEPRFVPEPQQQ